MRLAMVYNVFGKGSTMCMVKSLGKGSRYAAREVPTYLCKGTTLHG